jgi:hypothetical protein
MYSIFVKSGTRRKAVRLIKMCLMKLYEGRYESSVLYFFLINVVPRREADCEVCFLRHYQKEA